MRGVGVEHVVAESAPEVNFGADAQQSFEQDVLVDAVVPSAWLVWHDAEPGSANVVNIMADNAKRRRKVDRLVNHEDMRNSLAQVSAQTAVTVLCAWERAHAHVEPGGICYALPGLEVGGSSLRLQVLVVFDLF